MRSFPLVILMVLALFSAPAMDAKDVVDLQHTFFSRKGSWMTLHPTGKPATLRYYFARLAEEKGNLLDLTFVQDGQVRPLAITADPACLSLRAGGEAAPRGRAYFLGERDTVIDADDLGLVITQAEEGPDLATVQSLGERVWTVEHLGWTLRLDLLQGKGSVTGKTWTLSPEAGRLRVALRLYRGAAPAPLQVDVDRDIQAIAQDWERWKTKLPAVSAERRPMALSAWWNLWSLHTPKDTIFPDGAVLVAKADMNGVWAWDHCFPAMALSVTDLQAGLEQFLVPFHNMLPTGQLPDRLVPEDVYDGVTKPPIHGWALGKILEYQTLTPAQTADLYPRMVKWTEFWFRERDLDRNGIPAFGGEHSGWDSGWDNATVLGDKKSQYETPELQAYLVLQMKMLSRLAKDLGKGGEAAAWNTRADAHLKRLLAEFWNGKQFLVKKVGQGPVTSHSTSLLPLMTLTLGEHLPKPVFETLVKDLEARFLTPWGPATELPTSPLYKPDGYWRGPIWAPSTYMLADGLRRGGRPDLAKEIARRFCDLVEHAGGHWENYDALTGAPLRCKGFAWTSAVDLLFRHEYLR